MNIKIIIHRSVGKISRVLRALKNLKRSKKTRIKLPPTNTDWHKDYAVKSEIESPAQFIVSLNTSKGQHDHDWIDQVYKALHEVSLAIEEGSDIPTQLLDPRSGGIIGEVVIVDRNPEDEDWEGAIKMMSAEG